MTSNKKILIIFIVVVLTIFAFYFWNSSNVASFNVKKFGIECKIAADCGDIIGVNCNAEVDGPYYYVKRKSGEIISNCGGFCDTSEPKQREICDTLCPSKEWNCKDSASISKNECELNKEYLPNTCKCPEKSIKQFKEYSDHTGVTCVII